MIVLHLFPNEKFTVDYIKRVRNLFNDQEHIFWIYRNNNDICSSDDLPSDNIYWGEITNDYHIIKGLYEKADRIILHGLFFYSKELFRIILLCLKYKKPNVWIIWGGDLYDAYLNNKNKSIKNIINEALRCKMIHLLYGVATSCDYEVLNKFYNVSPKRFIAPYSYKLIDYKGKMKHNEDYIHVMVGHSATQSCCHLEAFELLRPFSKYIQVFCPLSYPNNQDYISLVINNGEKIFGDHFHPLLDFMDYEKYTEFLYNIDVGIFNNSRQQGNGNILNLLYLGKKVFISKENTLYNLYSSLGAILYNLDELNEKLLITKFTDDEIKHNRNIIEYRYSDKYFIESWNDVFTN